jgi:hypothetical protein
VRATSPHSPERALWATIEALRRRRISFALIGAWTLAVWGRPRATTDVDVLVFVDEERLEWLARQLEGAGFERDRQWEEWNPLLRGTQIRLLYGGVPVDVLRARDPHDRAALRRRRRRRLGGRYLWLVSPEDLILQKLKVGRPRDFEDALTVIDRCGTQLDGAYLWRCARRLGIAEELAYVERAAKGS